MAHIQGLSKDQYMLLPPSIEEWLPKDHPARVIELFVKRLDINDLGFIEENETTGRPSYEPETMIKIILYGYTTGERSSRKLEKRTYEDLAYIWLTGNLHPDYRTIARFRQNNSEGIKALLRETLKLYCSIGYKFDGIIFSDGSKIYANASDNNTLTSEKIKRLEEIAEKMLKEAEKADKEEDKRDGDSNGNFIDQNKLHKLEEEIKRSKEILKESGQKTVSLTDRDAKFMKHSMGYGKHLSYNGQLSVDKNGIILESDVETIGAESGEMLKKRILSAEKNTGKKVKKVVADTGYYETNAVKELMESGKSCIVPKRQEKNEEIFIYNKKKDAYKCVKKKELNYIRERSDKGKKYLVYAAKKENCLSCGLNGKCYKGKTDSKYGRQIMIYEDRIFTNKYRQTIIRNKGLYKKRKYTIEPVIGIIKSILKFRKFGLRGTENVKVEWSLVTTALNLIKIGKLMLSSG